MPSYSLYERRVQSDFTVDGLQPAQFNDHEISVELSGSLSSEQTGNDDVIEVYWPNIGSIRVCNGTAITIVPNSAHDARDLRNVLMGTSLAAVLHQQGQIPIHAGVVSDGDRSTAFVGPKRAGKSTTVAASVASGRKFLADDILAVRFEDGQPVAIPGFPLAKIEPQWVDGSFPGEPATNPETGRGKYYYDLSDVFERDPVPLSTINVLDGEADSSIEREPMTGHEAAMTLLRHAWPTRFRASPSVIEWTGDDGPALERYAKLAESCRVQRLSIPHSHESLAELGTDLEQVV